MRINGKIRAREVRVIAEDGQQVGILSLAEAIRLAQSHGVDLVEVASNATPPVCKLMDYHKYLYQQAKRDKEAKKHHHATKMKEVQLSASIDPHDYSVKLSHAIDFLCEEMKVKISLRFRGREMMHTEYGFQVVERFISDLAAYASPDAPARLVGRSVNVMLNPLPRNKRAKNPRQSEMVPAVGAPPRQDGHLRPLTGGLSSPPEPGRSAAEVAARAPTGGFSNNPFTKLDFRPDQNPEAAAES